MAAIAAGDVTCKVLSRRRSGALPYITGLGIPIEVELELTIDPGTDDTYPTGGIPLTTAFTQANGEHIDTGLDVGQVILEEGGGRARISTGVTVAQPAQFFNGGVTAAAQTLVLFQNSDDADLTYAAGTISAANADNSINDSATSFPVFAAGDIILISGFTGTAANNRIAVVVSRTTAKIVVSNLNGNASFVDDAAGETVTIRRLSPAARALTQHSATDVTAAGDIAAGDADIVYRTKLVGRLRHTALMAGYTVA